MTGKGSEPKAEGEAVETPAAEGEAGEKTAKAAKADKKATKPKAEKKSDAVKGKPSGGGAKKGGAGRPSVPRKVGGG